MKAKIVGVAPKSSKEAEWNRMYARLQQYHRLHGHTDVPQNWREDRRLASWVKIQRGRRVNGFILKYQIHLLDKLGFSWRLRERGTWEQRYADLLIFQRTHGHCHVPKTYPENPKLAMYARSLRALHSQGKMPKERLRVLEKLGFNLGLKKVFVKIGSVRVTPSWKENYESLLVFKAEHGHCDVPVRRHPYRAKLGQWVISQRRRKAKGTLELEEQRLLERAGFQWIHGPLNLG